MDKTGGEIDRFQSSVDKLGSIAKSLGASSNSSESHININAGSWVGVILMVAAAFVLGYSMSTSTNLSREISTIESKQVDQGDKLDAIYMMAPQLKPKENKDDHPK